MKEYGLDQGDIDVYVMAEIPSNIIRAEDFAEVFDGFSIGTNDLTQLTLGVDRNSDKLSEVFDERDPAVKDSIKTLINKAHGKDSHVGICGDAPSTHEGYAEFLVEEGIDAISVSPDVALDTILKVADAEENHSEIDHSVDEASDDNAVEVDINQVQDEVQDQIKSLSVDDIGKSAGEIYEVLNKHGKATASKLKDYTDEVDSEDVMNQALGWLAREGKIEVAVKKNGELKYRLESE